MNFKRYEYHDPPEPPKTGKPVHIGQTVTRKIDQGVDYYGRKETAPMKGTVVWIHPQGRFHVVEFRFGENVIQEAFFGIN